MYTLHYKCIKVKYGVKAKMLIIDTNNFHYIIKTENVYQDFYKDKQIFDYRNYAKESKYYDNTNNLVVSKMKDEIRGVPIKVLIGLK